MNLESWTTRFLPGGAPGSAPQVGSTGAGASRSLVGSRVGPYLISRSLGSGGVGEVFKGVDVMLQREVAIKVLHHEFASDPSFVERFSREAQLHAKLSHANVATVHAFLHEGDKQFMVMEYVAGISLEEFVRSGGPVPVARALGIFRRALAGIEHAHRNGIVHRDIKPANIMVADSGAVKVMDFGIARALDSQEHLTRHGQVAGTAKAMSPEQIRGGEADVRSDIYSLGIVLYTMLAGRAPFDADNDLELMKAQVEQAPPPLRVLAECVPPELEAAVMRALQKDPSARFQSVGEFARALDAIQDRDATIAAPRLPLRAPQEAPTLARTAVNPALGQAPAQPEATAVRAAPQEFAASATVVRPVPTAAASRKLPRSYRRAAAIALACTAVVAGAAVVMPRMGQRTAPLTVPPQPLPTLRVAPVEPVAVAPTPAAPQQDIAVPVQPAEPPVKPPEPAVQPARVEPRTLAIAPLHSDGRYRPGESIRLQVNASHDAHVYCYLQDETGRIVRFYPNRFRPNAQVTAVAPLDLPGTMRFEILANSRGQAETVACFAGAKDLLAQLPPEVVGTDFAKLPVASPAEVRSAFARVAAGELAEASFVVQAR